MTAEESKWLFACRSVQIPNQTTSKGGCDDDDDVNDNRDDELRNCILLGRNALLLLHHTHSNTAKGRTNVQTEQKCYILNSREMKTLRQSYLKGARTTQNTQHCRNHNFQSLFCLFSLKLRTSALKGFSDFFYLLIHMKRAIRLLQIS